MKHIFNLLQKAYALKKERRNTTLLHSPCKIIYLKTRKLYHMHYGKIYTFGGLGIMCFQIEVEHLLCLRHGE